MSVEDVRVADADRVDPDLATLAAGAALAEADWAVGLHDGELIRQVGQSPDVGWLVAFLAGSGHLSEVDETLPGDLVWAT